MNAVVTEVIFFLNLRRGTPGITSEEQARIFYDWMKRKIKEMQRGKTDFPLGEAILRRVSPPSPEAEAEGIAKFIWSFQEEGCQEEVYVRVVYKVGSSEESDWKVVSFEKVKKEDFNRQSHDEGRTHFFKTSLADHGIPIALPKEK